MRHSKAAVMKGGGADLAAAGDYGDEPLPARLMSNNKQETKEDKAADVCRVAEPLLRHHHAHRQ